MPLMEHPLTKLNAIKSLPAEERSTKIKHAVRNRFNLYSSKLIYSTVGYWLNRTRSRYMLELRPDSHTRARGYSDFDTLFEAWIAGNRHNNGGRPRSFLHALSEPRSNRKR